MKNITASSPRVPKEKQEYPKVTLLGNGQRIIELRNRYAPKTISTQSLAHGVRFEWDGDGRLTSIVVDQI